MIYFVGAGCGAADLITVRGMRILTRADTIIYTGSLVNEELLGYAKDSCFCYDSSRMTLDEVMEVMIRDAEKGEEVVRLHTGDPSLYGAIQEQMRILDQRGIHYETCPGVSACFGAAASLDLEFTLPDISQSLIITRMAGRTPVPEKESIESFAKHGATMAIYLSSGMLQELQERLLAGGYSPDTKAAIVYRATWPQEKKFICTVGTLAKTGAENGIDRFAVILVGDVIGKADYSLSKLYDPTFETGYRKSYEN